MAINEKFISPRKRLAMGGTMPDGDFGVDSLASRVAGGPTSQGSGYLKDDERGAGPPLGGNQRQPDHGEV